MFPSFRQIKTEAKASMMKRFTAWIPAVAVLVALQLLAEYLTAQFGGGFMRMLMDTVENNPNLNSGVVSQDGQILMLARLDAVGLLVGIALSMEHLWRYMLALLLSFVLLAPLQMGVLELLWKAFRGEEVKISRALDWYKKPALFAKALIVRLAVKGGSRLLSLLALAPGYVLYYFTYSGNFIGAQQELLLSAMGLISMLVLAAGTLLGFYFYTLLMPVLYCLAARPDYSVVQVFRQGLASLRGYRKKFFSFRLSFFLWHLASNMTYGAGELYVLPYITFSSLQFLQVAAVDRQEKENPHMDSFA